jgi:hypothetical protein
MYAELTFQRIKYWFHNNTRGSSSGTGTRGVLKLGGTPKLVHPWQAYQNKFYNTKLRPKVEEAWNEYLKQVPEGQKPKKTLFEIRNQVVRELYENETDEVKQEVEEHRKQMKAGKRGSDTAENNKAFQAYIPFAECPYYPTDNFN